MLYPILTETRHVLDLSGIWKFKLATHDSMIDVTEPLNTTQVMAVPGSYNDQGVVQEIRQHVGDVWYERTFTIPKHLKDERIVLRFGSATHYAEVYVDGKKVVEHTGGFLPFEADISTQATVGTHRLTVKVNNILTHATLPVGNYSEEKQSDGTLKKINTPNFDFFNYAGLHRPVKIYSTPKQYIKDIVIVPEVIDETEAAVHYEVELGNAYSDIDNVKVTILDASERACVEHCTLSGTMTLKDVHLWQPLNAYLYQLKVELFHDGELLDVYYERFGVRSVEVKAGQFLISNQPFYFKGFGKHEDTYYHGRGLNEVANVMDIELMKWIGANSFRTSHYPYSEEMMRLADEQGIVVIDETPAVGLHLNFFAALGDVSDPVDTWKDIKTQKAHEAVIRDLIQRDKNHACVVMWSIANEPESNAKGAKAYFEPLVQLARECDPQKRPVTIVTILMAQPHNCEVQDLVDVLCLNRYYGWYTQTGDLEAAKVALRQELEAWTKRQPGKPMMFTEYGADTLAGFHAIDDQLFTEEYQVKYYEANHEVIDTFDCFIGEQVWNFADFETSNGIIRVKGNKKGIFTRERAPKAIAHYFRNRWHAIPDFNYKS
ncbi:beta-glucuronidase [Staphylococcus agnetis]|uniref:beta-glucuronidase n=1 Tax=Staphylococcus agnetis TaxID=985762 RepID=UPI0004E2B8A9|nr:beta-glucuronidase [Staphylococcus agnetis]KFE42030.1 beta-D-glucuronidase [Staphylococcus agnetis]NJH65645.1 beta-glucuronidase [Staphylococcus agnetis]PTH46817.1 beta-glucuronidase [Staphylococcus agnetis]PTH74585.1 beta-glucuronidase [Staphylococcus agnetis]PTH74784.1 beta-glucuronidase [Staphylococcus agnetis]